MPTNVGPNTKGEENLVFGYDLGDVANSYKGQPSQNLWDSIDNTQTLRGSRTAHYWTGRRWLINNTYTHPGVPGPKGVKLGKVFKFTSGALSSTWSGNSYGYMLRDIACTSGNTFTVSVWAYVSPDCDIDSLPASIEGESGGESTPTGYSRRYDLNNKGVWQNFARKAISDGNLRFIPVYPAKNGVTDGSFDGFFMWAAPQVVEGSSPVQFLDGGETRSATQGLLDLKGNSTIDLSNVSFDSNAQMTFDGTDDYIDLGDRFIPSTGPFTMEILYQISTTGGRGGLFERNTTSPYNGALIGQGGAGNWSFQVNNGSQSLTSTVTYPTTNTWYHEIGVFNGSNTIYHYRNGTSIGTVTGSTMGNLDTQGTRQNLTIFKRDTNSGTIGGKVAVVKIYNRALTASEVQSNYNAIKGRFNI